MAQMRKRPWGDSEGSDVDGESTRAPSSQPRPWDVHEVPPGLADEDVDSNEEGDALTQPNAALQAFFNLFIDLYMSSTISAMTFCIGCFFTLA